MTDEKLTPGEHAAGITPERKRAGLEATGFRDTAAIEHNERTREHAGNVILRSARALKRLPQMLGRVHPDA
jgi:hypothetical protein